MPYRIEYSPDAEEHLREFTAREQKIILDTVDAGLSHRPTEQTRNRKPMRPNRLAPWELRIGDFRVFYDVANSPEFCVYVRAIGVKEHNTLRMGRKVIEL
uniref:mRNA-degrading endonuclease RelE, toxin component of the RelBE toxin-antitoxin system n=1 Tax=Candidatus Kentrum sp. FM TaxID=2126340 RepID=A0A450WS73_9GAMM|nr:MAG: mRNA-degrading endonuclease RelE, toxin component of the RelBE toxin-antitoxin system [Candidatus Kentron sp. FM]VFJ72203.1 MAG: mRNA-degrading endonuclease RelE, toxin component of the RelBE toxin-antitoxin system [Candidatus Kentron sp. FM]VFK19838.1 MAG: mRNA-degrading endonuclease RelE, toxin component of the RelBE toxin-antitoxin system [Candidatus Kentron sp. FM]